MKVIRIKSQREAFRRCGIAHSTEWTEYPEGFFDEQQIKRLKNEPTLWIEEVEKKLPAIKEETKLDETSAEKSKNKK